MTLRELTYSHKPVKVNGNLDTEITGIELDLAALYQLLELEEQPITCVTGARCAHLLLVFCNSIVSTLRIFGYRRGEFYLRLNGLVV